MKMGKYDNFKLLNEYQSVIIIMSIICICTNYKVKINIQIQKYNQDYW